MKKAITIILALLLAAAAFLAGRNDGIRHAIEDSEIWTVELYDPDNPEENARPDGTDQTIFIELDGDICEHGMFQC